MCWQSGWSSSEHVGTLHCPTTSSTLVPQVGICKIVPPKAWKPSKVAHLENREVVITRPIEQKVTGKQGVYQALLLERKEMSLQREFVPLAADPENQAPKDAKPEDLEREFWRSMNRHAPIYGADVEASFFDKSMKVRTAAAKLMLRRHVQCCASQACSLGWLSLNSQICRPGTCDT